MKEKKRKGVIFIKKITAALLCIILAVTMLCACSQYKPPEEPTEPTTQEPESLFFHLDSLPDIGEKKDNSFINKYWDGEAKNEFIPDENYKGIVPYVFGKGTYSDFYGSEAIFDGYVFGLATTRGEIITNGIYTEFGSETSSDNKQVYLCYESADEDGAVFVDIIAADGSWKVREEILGGEPILPEYDFITAKCATGSKIYDFDGNLIFDSEKLFGKGYTAVIKGEIGGNIIFKVVDGTDTFAAGIEDDFNLHNEVFAACVDRNGKILYTVKPENYYFTDVCGEYFAFNIREPIYNDNGSMDSYNYSYSYSVFDKNGKKVIDNYDSIAYDEITDLYVYKPNTDDSIGDANDSEVFIIADSNMKEVHRIAADGYDSKILVCNNESSLALTRNYYSAEREVSVYDLKTGKETELPKAKKSITNRYEKENYILIKDGEYTSVYSPTGEYIKQLAGANAETDEISFKDGIFYYTAGSKLYVETLENHSETDLGSNGQCNIYSSYVGGDLVYLYLRYSNSEDSKSEEKQFAYNKVTGALKETFGVIERFNTQSGIFTWEETNLYLSLLNENGEYLIRKVKSF